MQLKALTKEHLIDLLNNLVYELDQLDNEDFFGTEGWRKFLSLEDTGL